MSNENENQTANAGELDEQELDTVAGGQAIIISKKPKPSLAEGFWDGFVDGVADGIQRTWAKIAPNAGNSDGPSGNGTIGVRG
jgi:hypothetical protein